MQNCVWGVSACSLLPALAIGMTHFSLTYEQFVPWKYTLANFLPQRVIWVGFDKGLRLKDYFTFHKFGEAKQLRRIVNASLGLAIFDPLWYHGEVGGRGGKSCRLDNEN
jgi:hypothetical protein